MKTNTTITIKGDNDAIIALFDSIFDWVKKMHPDINDIDNPTIGRYYLKSVALHAGIDNVSKLGTFGFIKRWTYIPSQSCIEIEQVSYYWQICVVMWNLIAKKYDPNAVVTYKSECKSSNDYSTNIAEYTDFYVVETTTECNNKASRKEVETVLSRRYKGSFEEMYSSYKNKQPSSLNVAKWDIIPIAETV